MNQFFKDKSKYFKILLALPIIFLSSCDFFGLDSEMKHLTMKNLELISQTRLDSLDPAGEWLEATTTAYVNTRDSVAQKNFIDLNQITKGSINRIQISTIHPSDSTLFIVDSVNIFFTDNNRSIQVGFLYDVPTNSTPKLLDANIEQYDEGDLGNLFRSDTVFIKTSFHLRTLVRSDSMKFQVDALYGLRNH